MAKSRERSIRRNHHASLKELEESADAFRNKPGRGVSLLEMKMRAVKNEWDAVENGVVEFTFEQLETFFREERPLLGKAFHFGIIIDIEVFRAENLPVKICVLNFVAPEIIELRVERADSEE
jgi:hypothetical protein